MKKTLLVTTEGHDIQEDFGISKERSDAILDLIHEIMENDDNISENLDEVWNHEEIENDAERLFAIFSFGSRWS